MNYFQQFFLQSSTYQPNAAAPSASQQGVQPGAQQFAFSAPSFTQNRTVGLANITLTGGSTNANSSGSHAAAPAPAPAPFAQLPTSAYTQAQVQLLGNVASATSNDYVQQSSSSNWNGEHRGIQRPVNIFSDAEYYRHKRMERKMTRPTAKQYYCELCRISCVGEEPWTLHVAGRAHKQRERERNSSIVLEEAADGRIVAKAVSNSAAITANSASTAGTSALAAKATPSTSGVSQPKRAAPKKTGNTHGWYCEVCEVTCPTRTLFLMHVHGQKHVKRLKLYQQLGKSVPESLEQTLRQLGAENLSTPLRDSTVRSNPLAQQIEVAANRFVPGTTLKSVRFENASSLREGRFEADYAELQAFVDPKRIRLEEPTATNPDLKLPEWLTTPAEAPNDESVPVSVHSQADANAAASKRVNAQTQPIITSSTASSQNLGVGDMIMKGRQRRIASLERAMQQPAVGEEYLLEKYNQFGAFVSFFCKLCECDVNDLGGKMAHLRGKRHRLNYRDKVDPNMSVRLSWIDYKHIRGERSKVVRGKSANDTSEHEEIMLANRFVETDATEPLVRVPLGAPLLQPSGFGTPSTVASLANPKAIVVTTRLDRLVLLKQRELAHASGELKALLTLVNVVEQALKGVAIAITNRLATPLELPTSCDAAMVGVCILKGVMRVGDFANGTLIRQSGDDGQCVSLEAHLVVLASERPTRRLVEFIFSELPDRIHGLLLSEHDELVLHMDVASGTITVRSLIAPFAQCHVHVTSPSIRDAACNDMQTQDSDADQPKVQVCAEWLAETRRAKWFQARITPTVVCMHVLRILFGLTARRAELGGMPSWCWQLYVMRCFELTQDAHGPSVSPSILLRTVFASLASGLLLPAPFAGHRKFVMRDPCERDERDAFACVDAQTREHLTCFAQNALRMWTLQRAEELLAARFDVTEFDRTDKLLAVVPERAASKPLAETVAESQTTSSSTVQVDETNTYVSSKLVRRA